MARITVILGELRPRAALFHARGSVGKKLQCRLRGSELTVLPHLGLVVGRAPGDNLSAPVPWHIGQEHAELEIQARMTSGDQVMIHIANRQRRPLCRSADMAAGTLVSEIR